jgi:hypothetical protein
MTESAEAPKSDVTPAGGHFCGAQPPTIARAEAREATLVASSHGELMAAGEGGYPAGEPGRHATSQPMKGHDLLATLRSKF